MSKKSLLISCLVISLAVFLPITSLASGANVNLEKAERYTASQIYDALYVKSNAAVLDKVTMQPSLGITIPKVNIAKIHSNQPVPDNCIEDLKQHGYLEKEISQMDYGTYQDIAKTWIISNEVIEAAKFLYPELKDQDLTNWTMGKFLDYSSAKDKENNVYGMTPSLAKRFAQRNITLEDATTLLKDYYSYENVLAQSDADLKKALEGYYQFTLDHIKAQVGEISRLGPNPYPGIYVSVVFPGYNNGNPDWFHINSGSGNPSIAGAQSQRVQAIWNKLYNTNASSFTCLNLYGTYSSSQGGAHEGIDFSPPGNPSIYAVLSGKRIAGLPTHYDHQLCIQTSTWSSYSYLHMNYIAPAVESQVGDKAYVGTQGSKGNADGSHVHFEVQDGTNRLSNGKDQVLESYSPYIFF